MIELTFQATIFRAMPQGLAQTPRSIEHEKRGQAEAHEHKRDRHGHDVADMEAGLARAGLVFVQFDVFADFAGGHERSPSAPAPGIFRSDPLP
jgi:hypothetical protein